MTAAMTAAIAERPRLRQLDGLRAVAVGLVLAHHLWPMPAWAPPLGHWGVSLFFVLSGFLITRLLLDARDRVDTGASTRRRQAGVFFARRALRILPPYFLLLGVVWSLGVRRIDERIAWHAAYLSNWLFCDPDVWAKGGYDRHLWSLSVEEQFYLAWPWLILLAPRRLVPAVLVGTLLVGPAWRWWFWSRGWPGNWTLFPTPANADLLAAGGVAALLWPWRRLRPAAVASVAVGAAGVIFFHTVGRGYADAHVVLGHSALAAAFAGLVALVARGGRAWRALELRPIAYVGVISYGMYLVHVFMGGLAWHWLGGDASPWAVAALATALTLAAAAGSWHLMESPINRLKRLVPYS